ncbi:hypothetical protein A2886_00735 [candidate division WWE3 bacterium RIFCSPHIGHO2_01_FULL_42_13]|uniref:Uncharacterized protein n=1 Tax=candidate division WWE3 bacterium RIFCSPHIGHO2_01_FULL_42_13 TaxID=1802617 RepID=A0A1F4UQG8_UNCKA|nr:MAG: hypothetical protein A2886_00735 [candidate division WWE3 bacterium RIFCSPHIGHO2_01_FULL_42_13]
MVAKEAMEKAARDKSRSSVASLGEISLIIWFGGGAAATLIMGAINLFVLSWVFPSVLPAAELITTIALTGPLAFSLWMTVDDWGSGSSHFGVIFTLCVSASFALAGLAWFGCSVQPLTGWLAYPAEHIRLVPLAHLILLIVAFGIPALLDGYHHSKVRRFKAMR